VTVYEYSGADRNCIGQWPVRKVSGDAIELDVPSMAVLRFEHQTVGVARASRPCSEVVEEND